jgi:L-amino acid N-acyltransferase YncA
VGCLGRRLYEQFFDVARSHGCTEVRAVTNAVNEGSISFHRRIGFEVSDPIDGYDRNGVAHVRFSRQI